jgi:hemerythrin-like domain-containing protein
MGVLIRTIAAPGQGSTGPSGFDDPFAMLDACHERVRRMLTLLQRLHEHLQSHGADAQAQDAAQDILRYFDHAAPHHHLDEERHLVPVLHALGRPEDLALAGTLLAQHADMARHWAALREILLKLAVGDATAVLALNQERVQAFVRLYQDHIALEEGTIYPRSRATMDAAALAAAGAEMARRRGVPGGLQTPV